MKLNTRSRCLIREPTRQFKKAGQILSQPVSFTMSEWSKKVGYFHYKTLPSKPVYFGEAV